MGERMYYFKSLERPISNSELSEIEKNKCNTFRRL